MRPILIALAAGAVAAAVFTASVAQSGPSVGATVKDPKGQVLGVVEKVIVSDGRARQVQIRNGRVLRTLPIEGLAADNGAYVTVLSKAEFEALPGSE